MTLLCPGHLTVQVATEAGEIASIGTGQVGLCASVTLSSTNDWDTSFDDLVLAD